jgi:hypothetical protein
MNIGNLYSGLLSGASFLAAEQRAINAALIFVPLSDCGHHATFGQKSRYSNDKMDRPLLNRQKHAYTNQRQESR